MQKSRSRLTSRLALAGALFLAGHAHAQWDPNTGQWSRTEPTDLRVMTWNVEDGIRSGAAKNEALNQWTSLAAVVAAMQPDVLLLQETADNGSADSVAVMEGVIDQFMYGGGGATAYVQKYAPAGYDLPFVYVSSDTDGFNRNVIMSRYPFADLNGDTVAAFPDIFVRPDAYAPGGDGGVRGFAFAEIDLPDAIYAGDLVTACAHLKAFGDSSSMQQRIEAAQNVAYFIDYFYNGAGTGTPDPNNKITDSPAATSVLDEFTPVIFGGDWNEDEGSNGRKGPAEWMIRAQNTGGTDGTDFDRTDSIFDSAAEFFTGDADTQGNSKLDYIAWQDSKAVLRRSWIFDTGQLTSSTAPPEFSIFSQSAFQSFSNRASDHLPVLADFELALAAPPCEGDLNGDDVIDGADLGLLLGEWGAGPGAAGDLNGDGTVDGADLGLLLGVWGPC